MTQESKQHNSRLSCIFLIGYLAIHTFGLLMGTLLLPPSPSTFRRMQRQRRATLELRNSHASRIEAGEVIERHQPDKAAIELFSYAMVWWSLLGIVALSVPLVTTMSGSTAVHYRSTVSRRLVRMSYLHNQFYNIKLIRTL